MSQFGQCGPSGGLCHTIMLEADYVSPQMAVIQGIHWAFAVRVLELGVHVKIPDPRLQDLNVVSFIDADCQIASADTFEEHSCLSTDNVQAREPIGPRTIKAETCSVKCGGFSELTIQGALTARPARIPHQRVRFSTEVQIRDFVLTAPLSDQERAPHSQGQGMIKCALERHIFDAGKGVALPIFQAKQGFVVSDGQLSAEESVVDSAAPGPGGARSVAQDGSGDFEVDRKPAICQPKSGNLKLDELIPCQARAGALVIPSMLDDLLKGHYRDELHSELPDPECVYV